MIPVSVISCGLRRLQELTGILLGKFWMPIVRLLKRSPLMKRRRSIANIKHDLKTRLGEYK